MNSSAAPKCYQNDSELGGIIQVLLGFPLAQYLTQKLSQPNVSFAASLPILYRCFERGSVPLLILISFDFCLVTVSCLWLVSTMVCGIVIAKLLFWHAVSSAASSIWLGAVEGWQVHIIVRHDTSLVISSVLQSSEFSKPRSSLPDNDIKDEGADGGDTNSLLVRLLEVGRDMRGKRTIHSIQRRREPCISCTP